MQPGQEIGRELDGVALGRQPGLRGKLHQHRLFEMREIHVIPELSGDGRKRLVVRRERTPQDALDERIELDEVLTVVDPLRIAADVAGSLSCPGRIDDLIGGTSHCAHGATGVDSLVGTSQCLDHQLRSARTEADRQTPDSYGCVCQVDPPHDVFYTALAMPLVEERQDLAAVIDDRARGGGVRLHSARVGRNSRLDGRRVAGDQVFDPLLDIFLALSCRQPEGGAFGVLEFEPPFAISIIELPLSILQIKEPQQKIVVVHAAGGRRRIRIRTLLVFLFFLPILADEVQPAAADDQPAAEDPDPRRPTIVFGSTGRRCRGRSRGRHSRRRGRFGLRRRCRLRGRRYRRHRFWRRRWLGGRDDRNLFGNPRDDVVHLGNGHRSEQITGPTGPWAVRIRCRIEDRRVGRAGAEAPVVELAGGGDPRDRGELAARREHGKRVVTDDPEAVGRQR